MLGPRARISPSSAIAISTPAMGWPTVPARFALGVFVGEDRARLRQPVALGRGDAEGREGVGEVGAEGRPAHRHHLHAREPELLAELRVDELVGDPVLDRAEPRGRGGEVVVLGEVERPRPDLLFGALRLLHAQEHLVEHLLEHARDRREDGRADLREVLDELVRVRVVHLVPPRDVGEREHPRVDVGHRQERERDLLLVAELGDAAVGGVDVRRDVLVREHDALRHPRRPARVDEGREVAGLDHVAELVGPVRRLGLLRPPRLAERVERDEADPVRQRDARPAPLGQDHERHVLDLAGPAGEVLQHRLVGDEHGLGLAVLGHVDEVLGRVRRVERDVDDAGDERPEVAQ